VSELIPFGLIEIPGARELYEFFGEWPKFHDAELQRVSLNSSGSSSLYVHAWRLTDRINSTGYFETERHAVVELLFGHVLGMELSGQGPGTILFDLEFERTDRGTKISFSASYGLTGFLEVTGLAIKTTPGAPVLPLN
jgi:hypothetical protein